MSNTDRVANIADRLDTVRAFRDTTGGDLVLRGVDGDVRLRARDGSVIVEDDDG